MWEAADRRQVRTEKPGDPSDPVTREREHHDDRRARDGRARDGTVRLFLMAGEGSLAVRPRRKKAQASPGSSLCAGQQEPSHRVPPDVLVRSWRHGQPRVVGEEGDHRLDVVGAVGVGKPSRQCLLRSGDPLRRAPAGRP